ncbi:MAG: hypothetical protein C5B49_08875 [Bdellovibrio sp.]|nr:MAG: hypothetical protein C5B49_08875 [Bdellovibrio sp.]
MIAYLYRWRIKPGKENQFRENWTKVTLILRDQGGSYGSRLHLADNGDWIGYAQWPSREVRDRCNITTPELEHARELMKDAAEKRFPDLELEIQGDYLVQQEPQG